MDSLEYIPNEMSLPMAFHSIHTDDIQIRKNRTKALCYGQDRRQVLFTSRPLRLNEYVCFNIRNIKSEEFVAFAFTAIQPHNKFKWLDDDLKICNKIPKDLVQNGHLAMSFYLTTHGHVICELNDTQLSLECGKVDVAEPLWAVLLITNPKNPPNTLRYQLKSIEFKPMDLKAVEGHGTCIYGKERIRAGDHVVLQVLSRNFFPVSIGLTCVNPNRITHGPLQDFDPQQYYVVTTYDNILSVHDEISLALLPTGKVEYSLNGCNPRIGCDVDVKLDLWPFFSFNDHNPEVKVLSGYYRKSLPPNGKSDKVKPVVVEISEGPDAEMSADCKLCCDNPIDSVLYSCGHMCMCYECAMKQWKLDGDGSCPFCKEGIKDVIRVFR